ncbi:tRNA 2-selenouridine synthase [Brevundimonas sp. NIBR10]|uniref:tRNA 2-selenouridine(34) synthase MnmH n=1 Tax=Brevundimonas sp. NIBR10 TaxID=3015997 RepID=UPI0022F15854|nr:tRNA 2-selenouridine(34) synthase MnmH [Brevundimonas sp. NIBR10]WGM45550.1 tRNA 2-selenouridine synthase [Brevundimonas sp. NIBR10]
MIRLTTDLETDARAGYDALIDVRSPAEFAEDHIPGAINLPVLDDAQRAEVGTEYVQGSKFLARRRGAGLVARNIAAHLEGPLGEREGGFKPLVYCWRGGQRSHAMATVMDQVGWPVAQLTGGYQTWRRRVLARLYDVESEAEPLPPLVLLDGPTGVGKTAVLALMAERGAAVLDLEGLAAHRGSLFGATAQAQPPQKLFDSRLAVALEGLDPTRPVLVEAEASRIGALTLPPRLWAAMKAAPRIALTGSLDDRTAFSRAAYADIAADPEALDAVLSRLPLRLGRAVIERWKGLARDGDLSALIAELLETHYDPAYRRAASKYEVPVAAVASPVFGSEVAREASLAAIEAALHGFSPER